MLISVLEDQLQLIYSAVHGITLLDIHITIWYCNPVILGMSTKVRITAANMTVDNSREPGIWNRDVECSEYVNLYQEWFEFSLVGFKLPRYAIVMPEDKISIPGDYIVVGACTFWYGASSLLHQGRTDHAGMNRDSIQVSWIQITSLWHWYASDSQACEN